MCGRDKGVAAVTGGGQTAANTNSKKKRSLRMQKLRRVALLRALRRGRLRSARASTIVGTLYHPLGRHWAHLWSHDSGDSICAAGCRKAGLLAKGAQLGLIARAGAVHEVHL